MKVTFGLKAHSGWAALVVLSKHDGKAEVVDRRRIELVKEAWARQPYHAAEDLKPAAAVAMVRRGVEAAHRISAREVRAAVKRERDRKNEVTGCAVLVAGAMPDWSVEEILAVHIRMHKAEGVLFRDALVRATNACGLRLLTIPEKLLMKHAESALGIPARFVAEEITALGKSVGPPWGKDQKDAALAALIALQKPWK